MKRDKLRIVDTLGAKNFHEPFHSALLSALAPLFDHVEYCCSRSSRPPVENRITKQGLAEPVLSNVVFRRTRVIQQDNKIADVIRYQLSAIRNTLIFLFRPQVDLTLFTNDNPLSLWWIDLLSRLLKRRAIIICHGELELLTTTPRVWKFSRLYRFLILRQLRRSRFSTYLQIAVLGESLHRNLIPFVSPGNKKNIIWFDHPYFFDEQLSRNNPGNVRHPLRIGTIGLLNRYKGLYLILELGSTLRQAVDAGRLSLTVIGKTPADLDYSANREINFLGKGTLLDRETYDASIRELDYVLFLYAKDTYRLTASGAIFDAISMGKPILTLANSYFDYVLGKAGGPAGYVCDNISELTDTIDRLCHGLNPEDYQTQVSNIINLRQHFSIDAVRKQLSTLL